MSNLCRIKSGHFFRIVLIGLLIFGFCTSVAVGADTVNINTADREQLMSLKYVGESLAEKIVEFRKDQPFQTPEEIMNVKGIGEKIFEANKDRIVVKDE